MLPRLLDPENEHGYVWPDSAYSDECFEVFLSLRWFREPDCEKGMCKNPLGKAAKKLNRVKSAIRACVECFWGCMAISMAGKMARKIGLAGGIAMAWWGLKKLKFNLLRYL